MEDEDAKKKDKDTKKKKKAAPAKPAGSIWDAGRLGADLKTLWEFELGMAKPGAKEQDVLKKLKLTDIKPLEEKYREAFQHNKKQLSFSVSTKKALDALMETEKESRQTLLYFFMQAPGANKSLSSATWPAGVSEYRVAFRLFYCVFVALHGKEKTKELVQHSRLALEADPPHAFPDGPSKWFQGIAENKGTSYTEQTGDGRMTLVIGDTRFTEEDAIQRLDAFARNNDRPFPKSPQRDAFLKRFVQLVVFKDDIWRAVLKTKDKSTDDEKLLWVMLYIFLLRQAREVEDKDINESIGKFIDIKEGLHGSFVSFI